MRDVLLAPGVAGGRRHLMMEVLAYARDEAIAAASAGATYAGDADPYRHDDEEDDAEKDWA